MNFSISSLIAHLIFDSRGEHTIEVTLTLNDGTKAHASVPQGKSVGLLEAISLPAATALAKIGEISAHIKGEVFDTQKDFDAFLCEQDGTANKAYLGANTMLAVSLACARACAVRDKKRLWEYIRELYGEKIVGATPLLFMNMINGGAHAENDIDIQEHIIIPNTPTTKESLLLGVKFYEILKRITPRENGRIIFGDDGGIAPDFHSWQEAFQLLDKVTGEVGARKHITYGIDAAATQTHTSTDVLFARYEVLKEACSLTYIEDPFPENDFSSFSLLLKKYGKDMIITGDNLTVTNLSRMSEAYKKKSVNGVIIKPNQAGTLTETLDAVRLARTYGWKVIVSHMRGETNDTFIADLAWAVGADALKAGAPGPYERMVKYERLVEIEENEDV